MKNRIGVNAPLLIFVALFIAYAVMTVVSYHVSAIIRETILFIIITIIIVNYGIDDLLKCLGKLLPIYIFAILNLFVLLFNEPERIVGAIYDLSSYVIISTVFLLLFQKKDIINAKHLMRIVAVIYIITVITTIYGNMVYPAASRKMATGMGGELALYNHYRSLNIGGFGFIYEIVLPMALIPFVYKQKVIPRVLSLGVYLLVFYVIYVTDFTFAMIITAAFGVFFFIGKINNTKKLFVYALLFAIILNFALPAILGFLSSVSSDLMAERFDELGNLFSGAEVSEKSDVGARQSYYMESIDAFLSKPFSGTGTQGGGHSFILDNMAKYGSLGVIAVVIMLRGVFVRFIKPFKNAQFYPYLLSAYFAYIFLLVFNTSPLYMSISFVIPLMSFLLNKDYQINNN